MADLPLFLQKISEAVERKPSIPTTITSLQPIWDSYLSRLRSDIPEINIEGGGESVVLGTLSPGCQACKAGMWDCIFLSNRCNLRCAFCYSPLSIPEGYIGSPFGSSLDEIIGNYARVDIRGVSFSGGEPFLEPDKLCSWLRGLVSHFPDMYYWVYTNGLLLNEAILQKLSELGLNEIRINAAATSYDHPKILSLIELCAHWIENVTVEIPAIPEHADRLLASITKWSQKGVKYLNLHELIFEPGTLSASMEGPRQVIITEDGHETAFHLHSREIIFNVMQKVRDEGIHLSVNDCSMQSKLCQVRSRRRSLLPLVKEKFEKFLEERLFEAYAVYKGPDGFFFHPDSLKDIRSRFPDWQFVRVARRAPLYPSTPHEWVIFEKLSAR